MSTRVRYFCDPCLRYFTASVVEGSTSCSLCGKVYLIQDINFIEAGPINLGQDELEETDSAMSVAKAKVACAQIPDKHFYREDEVDE